MGLPVGLGDLVADQAVGRRRVGNPQQRLGQAQQHDAFLARQRKLADEGVEAALAVTAGAHGGDERARPAGDLLRHSGGELGTRQQRIHMGGFLGQPDTCDGLAQRVAPDAFAGFHGSPVERKYHQRRAV